MYSPILEASNLLPSAITLEPALQHIFIDQVFSSAILMPWCFLNLLPRTNSSSNLQSQLISSSKKGLQISTVIEVLLVQCPMCEDVDEELQHLLVLPLDDHHNRLCIVPHQVGLVPAFF
jgi:hypothetical protein